MYIMFSGRGFTPSHVNFEFSVVLGIHLVKKYGIQFLLKFSL